MRSAGQLLALTGRWGARSLDAGLPGARMVPPSLLAALDAAQALQQRPYSVEGPGLDTPQAAKLMHAAEPPGAAARAPPAGRRPPYRVRRDARALDDRTVDFAERLFAVDLECEEGAPGEASGEASPATAADSSDADQQQEHLAREGPSTGATAALAAAAADAAAAAPMPSEELAAAAAAAYAGKSKARAKRGQARGVSQAFEDWLAANADSVRRFRAAAAAQGLGGATADALVSFLFTARKLGLLSPVSAAAEEGEEPAATELRAEAGLREARQLVCGALGLPAAALPAVLRQCPGLLARRPSEEALAGLQRLYGGRAELAEAALGCPPILRVSPAALQRRLELLCLHLGCTQAEAQELLARHAALLSCGEQVVSGNARFVGSMLPARPYHTVLGRFPELLTARLQGTLAGLQRAAPPQLAAVDLTLLASQQPTLLLAPPRDTVAAWHRLAAVCEGVPAWRDELAGLAAPTAPREQQRAAAAAASEDEQQTQQQQQQLERQQDEGDSWFAEVYSTLDDGSGSGSGITDRSTAASARPAAKAAAAAAADTEPWWAYRDEEGRQVAATPGAFGTQQRAWEEGDRLRVRQLARLLAARRWQQQRLEFLVAEAPEEAGQQRLLDVVMAPKAAWEARHPRFPAWLDEQRQRRWDERERRQAERQAAAEAAAAEAEAAAEGLSAADAAAAAAVEAAAAAAGGRLQRAGM